MARVGFRKAKYNKIDTTTGKYATLADTKVPVFEKIVDEKFTPNFNSAELYGNDALVESDYTFIDGSIELTVCDDEDKFCAELLGNTVSSNDSNSGEVTQNIDDTAPYFGYGHIIPKVVNGVKKYKVEFFPKVKFNSITSEASTRGQSVEYKTTSVSGKVFALEETLGKCKVGDWEKHQTFDTVAKAETYLDSLLTPETGE